ncbi:MAG: leucyl aminopeptidase [Chloroflexota bacterium]|nr:leucyl aminopeptidase [Chloroflexota bacterium]MDE2840936.1 leucyl aminopeptidase [Chloroflexota bacterium]MDE2930381.1 leucyl aminopeptidase [Chloroflexota bacterium]
MNVATAQGNILEHDADIVIVNLFDGVTTPSGATGAVDRALDGQISNLIAAGDFEGKLNETLYLYANGGLSARRVLLVGLGKQEEFTLDRARQAAGKAARTARDLGAKRAASIVHGAGIGGLSPVDAACAAAEGTVLGLYRYERYKSDKDKKVLDSVTFVEADDEKFSAVSQGVSDGIAIGGAQNFVRDLATTPGSDLPPAALAEAASSMAQEFGLQCTILGPEEIAAENMNVILGVSRGSAQPCRFIVLDYTPDEATDQTIALVGKGITFDTGGLNLKPGDSMRHMECDMAGGASVIGAMRLVGHFRPNVRVIGLVPASENMPGGNAFKPGDVLRAANGKTIEIDNTDAEGRLVLADALCYAQRYNPSAIIDIATLTGAVIVALGQHAGGLMTNHAGLAARVKDAGEVTGERVWELPLWPEYEEQVKSPVADVKNTGGRAAGSITGAALLKLFVDDKPWVHLDVAGVDYTDLDRPYIPKGSSGFGARLLFQVVRDWEDGLD